MDRNTEFPDFDENVRATTFYTTGTAGLFQRRLFQPQSTGAGYARPPPQLDYADTAEQLPSRRCVHARPRPMFHVHA